MGNFEARLERERDRRDAELWQAHERGEHAAPVKDCNRCWAAAKEAAGRPKDARQFVLDKIEAASYHRNYRQACIDIQAFLLDNVSVPARASAPVWYVDEEGYVREPLSYENREGDPAFNGALDKW